MAARKTILVTGGFGVIGSHVILEAFKRGFGVNTTVRSPRRIEEVRHMLLTKGATQDQVAQTRFFPENELYTEDDYADAVRGCSFVVHRIPYGSWSLNHVPYDDLISLARDPVLNLLHASKASGTVSRVVIINSFAAVGGNKSPSGEENYFTEADWTNMKWTQPVSSLKRHEHLATIAERAIWEWVENENTRLQVAVINPVTCLGPLNDSNHVKSVKILADIMTGQYKEGPDLKFGVVDARDLADLAFRCITDPSATGERFIACTDGDFIGFNDIAKILKKGLSKEESKQISVNAWGTFTMKLLRFTGVIENDELTDITKSKHASNQKARDLGWMPRSAEECVMAAAMSIKEFENICAIEKQG